MREADLPRRALSRGQEPAAGPLNVHVNAAAVRFEALLSAAFPHPHHDYPSCQLLAMGGDKYPRLRAAVGRPELAAPVTPPPPYGDMRPGPRGRNRRR